MRQRMTPSAVAVWARRPARMGAVRPGGPAENRSAGARPVIQVVEQPASDPAMRGRAAVTEPVCRACRGRSGDLVLDLGEQPACDYFPAAAEPGPDPAYPLEMWLCAGCGLAQLVADPTVPEEPRAAEPAALT